MCEFVCVKRMEKFFCGDKCEEKCLSASKPKKAGSKQEPPKYLKQLEQRLSTLEDQLEALLSQLEDSMDHTLSEDEQNSK